VNATIFGKVMDRQRGGLTDKSFLVLFFKKELLACFCGMVGVVGSQGLHPPYEICGSVRGD
jgi:hypothetical protein